MIAASFKSYGFIYFPQKPPGLLYLCAELVLLVAKVHIVIQNLNGGINAA